MFVDLLKNTFYGNPVLDWLIAAGIMIAVWLVLLLVRKYAATVVGNIARKTDTTWDDVVAAVIPKTNSLFLLTMGVLAGSRALVLSEDADKRLLIFVGFVAFLQAGIWATHAINFFVQSHRERVIKENPASVSTVSALGMLAQLVVWVMVVLLVLQNAGVEIGPLLAGLGVGGIAVALALQTVLKDLFASLSIMFDKPFVVGDFMIIDDLLGVVEKIGLKTTRLRSLWGEQLVFSNNDLLESRIRNFGRMYERRVAFKIGVTYQTPREKIKMVPGIFKAAIEAQKLTRFDRAHFFEYGNFSLNYEIVYYIQSPDYNVYMDIQQAINLIAHEEFEKAGIEFAYPTQTLFVAGQSGNSDRTSVD